jgi:flagellar hook-length control protein FliK
MTAVPAFHPALTAPTALPTAGSVQPVLPGDPTAGTETAAAPSDSAFSAVLQGLGADCSSAGGAAGTGTDTTSLSVPEPLPASWAFADSAQPGVSPLPIPPPDSPATGENLPVDGQSMPPDDLEALLTTLGDLHSDPNASQIATLPGTAEQPQPLPLSGPVPTPPALPASIDTAGESAGNPATASGVAGRAVQELPTAWHQEAAATERAVQDTADPAQGPSPGESGAIEQALPAEFRARLQAMMAPLEHSTPGPDTLASPLVSSYPGTTGLSAATASSAPSTQLAFAELPALQPQADQEAWTQGLGERLLLMAEKGQQNATLRLQPEQLGPLQIHIRVDEDGASQVLFSAHHAQTREAIEQAMPRLRELFAEQGLNLAQADVDSGRGTFNGRDFDTPGNAWPQDAGTETETGESQNATLWQLHPASRRRLDVLV